MSDNIVKLIFQSVSTGGGLDDFVRKSRDSLTNAGKLAQGIGILSNSFGGLGQMVGKALGMFMQGGIWGAAALAVNTVVDAIRDWRNEASLAAEENAKAVSDTKAKAEAAAASIREAYRSAASAIDDEAKRKIETIEINKKLIASELELAAAKARAAGKDDKATSIERRQSGINADAAVETKAISREAAEQKLATAMKQASGLSFIKADGTFDKKAFEKERRRRNGRIYVLNAQIEEGLENNRDAVASAGDKGGSRKTIVDTDELKQRLKVEQEARMKLIADAPKIVQATKNIAEAKRELAAAQKEEATAQNASSRERLANLVKQRQDEAQAAEARRRADRDASAVLSNVRAGSASRFEAAFDLWRDPEAAQRAQDEAKAKTADLRLFRKSVDRYGGKWRIDEAARLMRDGDEEGLQSRLAEWRKSAKFNGQTEQMVLAAAADQNKNAADRALVKIENYTKETQDHLAAIRKALEGSLS